MNIRYIVGCMVSIGLVTLIACQQKKPTMELSMVQHAYTLDDIIRLFPKKAEDIEQLTQQYMKTARVEIKNFIALPKEQWTFKTVAQEFDRMSSLSDIVIFHNVISVLEMLHPSITPL